MAKDEKKKGGLLKKLGIGFIVLIALGAVFGNSDDDKAEAGATQVNSTATEKKVEEEKVEEVVVMEPELEVTASDIYEAYQANELKANKEYEEKYIAVTGYISSVDEIFGKYSVSIDDGADFSLVSVIGSFDKDKEDELIEFEKGQKVTINGVCDGFNGLSVSLDDCSIVSAE